MDVGEWDEISYGPISCFTTKWKKNNTDLLCVHLGSNDISSKAHSAMDSTRRGLFRDNGVPLTDKGNDVFIEELTCEFLKLVRRHWSGNNILIFVNVMYF